MDKQAVIVRYTEHLEPSDRNPTGRLAGEQYEVRNVGAAKEHHPDAEIVAFVSETGQIELTSSAAAKRKWTAFEKEQAEPAQEQTPPVTPSTENKDKEEKDK